MLSDKMYRLLPRADEVRPEYLLLALSSNNTQRHLSTLKTGLAESQTNISQAIVRSLWIPVPDRIEQVRICTKQAGHSLQAQLEGSRLAKLRSLKQGLMDDLLTGRVRVAVPEEATS
jgi:type I restriction enzyme S subunit